jgi:hypothetical protein
LCQGRRATGAQLGTVVEQIHSEAATVHVMQIPLGEGQNLIVRGRSALDLGGIVALRPRADPRAALMTEGGFRNFTLDFGGAPMATAALTARGGSQDFSPGAFGNHPARRQRSLMTDSGTVHLSYDPDVDRILGEAHWAELFWASPGGGAPAGRLRFVLDEDLVARGWKLVGPASLAAAGAPALVRILFYAPGKTVTVQPYRPLPASGSS